ncbi:hypothetical protein OUZ56_026697 [Daphnia magna]|uniref:Uncharacterized protein n=1 Tax=Daphnia magna TaxID=35525 RepID=A0ABQ9ZMI2_9CRUS|nr:hypothetical protein OUZ56_026697 [Daphnia magna]
MSCFWLSLIFGRRSIPVSTAGLRRNRSSVGRITYGYCSLSNKNRNRVGDNINPFPFFTTPNMPLGIMANGKVFSSAPQGQWEGYWRQLEAAGCPLETGD